MDEEKSYRQPWFKFYAQDWLTDLKVRRMSAVDRACYLTVLCLASSSRDRGTVRGVTERDVVSLASLSSHEDMEAAGCIDRFERNGSVTVARNADQTLDVTLPNFTVRQASSSTNAERQAKYRERHKTSQQGHNKAVTQRNKRNSAVTTEVTYRGDKSRGDKSREDMGEGSAAAPTPRESTSNFFSMVMAGGPEFDAWLDSYASRYGIDRDFLKAEALKFTAHWTELNKGGTRAKWELQETFQAERRLATWLANAQKWSRERQQPKGKQII